MQHAVPVDTPVGILTGRDAISLDESTLPAAYGDTLTLVGELNGRCCSRNPAAPNWRYTITFTDVHGVRIAAVEFSDHPDHVASFEEVLESDWLADMQRADPPENLHGDAAHYRFWTNDDVFEIICAREFALVLTPLTEPATM